MKMKLFTLALSFLVVLALVSTSSARKTRDLVFEDDDDVAVSEKAPVKVSVKTTLELNRGGEVTMVTPTHQFKSGDKVKLRYTTNSDGYVYWMAKMSSGKYAMLFPNNKTGMDNYIRKNEEHTIPVKGSLRFDDTPGTESLLMVFCSERIPELEAAVAEANGSKSSSVDSRSSEVANIEDKNTQKRRSRDLVFEDDDDEEVNTKTQVAPKGEPFVTLYELKHK